MGVEVNGGSRRTEEASTRVMGYGRAVGGQEGMSHVGAGSPASSFWQYDWKPSWALDSAL